jgi:hypothetical protein
VLSRIVSAENSNVAVIFAFSAGGVKPFRPVFAGGKQGDLHAVVEYTVA